jgi:hypothetical protein
MLKIYLDWNCITHAKDLYPYILSICEECGDRFIFPYSNAHIRDLMVSKKSKTDDYPKDRELLERICGKHLLSYENGQMQPYFGLPTDYIDISGNALEAIQNLSFITPESYRAIKDSIKLTIPDDIYKKIQGARPEEAITLIDNYINSKQSGTDLWGLMDSVPDIFRSLVNFESQFKSVCIGLDLFGYRPEKRGKTLMNIDADASHVFYAAHCDLFVTADKKLRDKAQAIYKRYGYQTRVMSPWDFASFIDEELRNEYSLANIVDVIEKYGVPRSEDDGLHYQLMPSPVFGLFNVCHKMDKNLGYYGNILAGLFRYSFNNTPYLFYTEMEHFFNLFSSVLPSSEKERFQDVYIAPMISRNREITSKASYTLDCPDSNLRFYFCSDSLAPVPCPMLEVIVANKDAIIHLTKQISQ